MNHEGETPFLLLEPPKTREVSAGMKKTVLGLVLLSMLCVITGCQKKSSQLSDFKYHEEGNSVVIDEYVGKGGVVIIPSKINSKNVTKIGGQAFRLDGMREQMIGKDIILEEVILPDNLEIIGWEAFQFARIKKISRIPKSVTEIGQGAFMGCSDLTVIEAPKHLKPFFDDKGKDVLGLEEAKRLNLKSRCTATVSYY